MQMLPPAFNTPALRLNRAHFGTLLCHAAVLAAMASPFTAHGRTLTIIGDGSTSAATTAASPDNTRKRDRRTMKTTTATPTTTTPAPAAAASTEAGRGFPTAGPWASFYGAANTIDLPKMAATYRIMDIDADPDMGNFTASQIKTLKNGGTNKVLSYLNLGSCENFRGYWSKVPAGFLSCSANKAAQLGTYAGYGDEVWMNVGNADYQNLVINYIVPRLAAQGVDGFYFDNMEIVEHGTNTRNGPCDAQCSQGGLNLIARLRDKYPSMLFVLQNATSNKTRLGQATGASGTVAFPSLLDGIAHEEVYKPTYDAGAEAELVSWSGMNLTPGGHKFWIATLDYVSSCTNTAAAQSAFQSSRARGFSPSVSDSSAGQQTVCYWPPTF